MKPCIGHNMPESSYDGKLPFMVYDVKSASFILQLSP